MSAAPATRATGDDGAVLVEFALVLPLLALLFSGIIEFGSAYRVRDQLQHTLMGAGRVAGQQSDGRYADYETLRNVSSSMSSLSSAATVRRVIVYKAPANGQVPASCLAVTPTGSKAGVSGLCNVYGASQVATSSLSGFATATSCSGSAWDANWCPTSRVSGTDRVGVYVELAYTGLTKLLPLNFTISGSAVYDVEPIAIGS